MPIAPHLTQLDIQMRRDDGKLASSTKLGERVLDSCSSMSGNRHTLVVVIVGASALFSALSHATPPPLPPSPQDQWGRAIDAADDALKACGQVGIDHGLYGDVVIEYRVGTRKWTTSASKSLGTHGRRIRTCARLAMAKHLRIYEGSARERAPDEKLSHTLVIGTPRVVLPAASQLMPIWKRVATGSGKGKRDARRALARMLPPDYALGKRDCLRTTRRSMLDAEYSWLPTAGQWVPPMWEKLVRETLRRHVGVAMWDPSGFFITTSDRGLCLERFDSARQRALRARFDAFGSCWAGGFEDILLHPRVAFPTDKRYASVSTWNGRACAVTAAGGVDCCGPVDPPLPPAPKPVTSIALGHGFACGLDARGQARCWGDIVAPPAGRFTKISASHTLACGLRTSGEIACWGAGNPAVVAPPKGTFVDVSASSFSSCGVRTSGAVVCWGEGSREPNPPGTYVAVAATWTHACGVRKNGTIGCWSGRGMPVITPAPHQYEDVAVGDAFRVCGRRVDGTVSCWGWHPPLAWARLRPPPATRLATLVGDQQLFCGVRPDAGVECFGDPWPGTWLGDNTWRFPTILGLTGQAIAPSSKQTLSGRVVDGANKPIAGAEVLVCSGEGPCMWAYRAAMTTPGTLAQLVATLTASWKPDRVALATSGADGRWTATVAIDPDTPRDAQHAIRAVITAPGREVVERFAAPIVAPSLLATDIALQPARALDIVPMCGTRRCRGTIVTAVTPNHRYDGAHLERLVPGTYTIEVRVNPGERGERVGTAIVDVTHAARARRVKVTARPVR